MMGQKLRGDKERGDDDCTLEALFNHLNSKKKKKNTKIKIFKMIVIAIGDKIRFDI